MSFFQYEKEDIEETVNLIQSSIENLKFPKMNLSISQTFNEDWKDKFSKLLYQLENYKKNEYSVVILGRLNSGKSTLLNALLGYEILPSANNDTTSLLTKIHFGNCNKTFVIYDNNQRKSIKCDINEIEKYVNYRGQHYSKKIKQIDIVLNNDLLRNGINFYDSPGLDSINELNKVISYDILNRSNSVILAFSGQDGGGNENYELIKKIFSLNFNNNYNVIFAITKCDLLDEEEFRQARNCLMELTNKAKKELGQECMNDSYSICGISAYFALKYQQIMDGKLKIEDAIKNKKLIIQSSDDLPNLYKDSNFDLFKKMLQTSIKDSNNKKRQTQNLLVATNKFLSMLLEDYVYIYKEIDSDTKLSEMKKQCEEQKKLINLIKDQGKITIKEYKLQIEMLNSELLDEQAHKILDTIFCEIVTYIEETPYEILSRDKFENLNDNIVRIAEENGVKEIHLLDEERKAILQNTIIDIEKIEQDYRSKIANLFVPSNEEDYALTFYGVKVKSHFLLSGIITTLVSGTLGGVGAFTIGNTFFPAVGGIIATVIGALLGIIGKALGENSEQKKKEVIRQKIHKELDENVFLIIRCAILELNNKYLSLMPVLEECLDSILVDKTNYYDQIIVNYNEIKETNCEIRKNMHHDMQLLKDLYPVIGNVMSKYLKEYI